MTLREIWENHTGRYTVKRALYPDIYDKYLAIFVGKPVTLIEFGVLRGGSLQIWRKFLGNTARIIGVDSNPQCRAFSDDADIVIGNQQDESLLANLPDPDIVIDDCGHSPLDQMATFRHMWPRLKNNGVYAVEDLDNHAHFVQNAFMILRNNRFPFHLHRSILIAEKITEDDHKIRAGS